MFLPPITKIMKRLDSKNYLKTQGSDYIEKMKYTEPHQPMMKYNN